jgi:putative redox protein
VFTAIDIAFRIEGAVDPALAAEAARLSQTRFCAISAMLSQAVPIRYEVFVNDVSVGRGQAQFAPDS